MSETPSNFLDACLAGRASLADIDDEVDRWHELGLSQSLSEFLGMTHDDYALWVEHPDSLRAIVARRKATHLVR